MQDGLQQIRANGETIILERGATLNHERLFLLESGKMALRLASPRGETISVFYHSAGQLVNFMPLLVRCFPIDEKLLKRKLPGHMFHIKALEECRLLSIDNDWFMNGLIRNEAISALALYSCIVNLINVYARAYNCPILSNAQRICRMILSHTDDNPRNPIPLYLTHAEISSYLSIHPITVSKIFGRLRNLGIIRKKSGMLVIEKIDELRAIAGGLKSISY